MKKRIPLFLVVVGVCLIAAGFFYEVSFAGIPYQDSTPEMKAKYDYHAGIASKLTHIGIYPLSVGLLGVVALAVVKKKDPDGGSTA